MEELSRPVWQDQPPARNAAVEEALASLIAVHGYSLFTQAGRLRRLLTEAAPDAPRHIAVVIVALSAEIPQRASRAKSDAALAGALQEWVQYLQQHASLEAAWATWAVAVWAHAIGLPTVALGIVMDADTFPTRPAARAPMPRPGTARARVTGDVVRSIATTHAVEPAFGNRRAEPSLGGPSNDDLTASGNLIDPLFPEQRPRATTPGIALVVEPSPPPPLQVAPRISTEAPTVAAMHGPAAVATPSRRDARIARQVIGGIALVAIGVAIGFALSSAMRPGGPAASTSGAPTAATGTRSPSPAVVVDPKPQDADALQSPRQAPRSIDETVATAVEPLPSPIAAADPTVASNASSAPKRASNTADASTRSRSAASRSCTAATCGTVVSARELGGTGTVFAYDILVRMDNRDARSFAARYRLQTGSRVRLSGGRFVPLDSRRE